MLAVAPLVMSLHVWNTWTQEICWLDRAGVEQSEHTVRSQKLRCAGVTAPQLALLETMMLKMERVDTWVLMMGGGSGVDVFLVGIPAARSSHSCGLHGGWLS